MGKDMARTLRKQLQKTGVAAQLLLSRPLQLTSQPTTADSTQWAGTSALPPIRASDLKTGMENQLQFYRHHQYLAPDIKFALAFSIFSLKPKLLELGDVLHQKQVDLLGLCEMRSATLNRLLVLPGCRLLRAGRSGDRRRNCPFK